nr:MAG: DNA pilot protein [Microvirus sp.]
MPIPLATFLPSIIGAGSQLAGGLLNSVSQGSQNRRSRRFAREQYGRERADNLSFWQQQNEYNSPSNQVSRLKKAGLNPALLYGGSASGAAGQAGPLKAPSSQSPKFQSSNPGNAVAGAGLSYMNALYDLELKQAQTNNLKSQNDVLVQDASLRAAQTANTLQSTKRGSFDLGLASELRSVSAEAAKENLRRVRTGTDIALDENERKAAMNSSNLREAVQRVLNMREQNAQTRQATANLKKDGSLKQYDIELRKLGINPNDPMWSRIVGRLINNYMGELSRPKIKNFLKPGLKQALKNR